MVNREVSPAYRIARLIEKHVNDLEKYRQREGRNAYIEREKEWEIGELRAICADVSELEPFGLLRDIARKIRRNTLLDVDISVFAIPNREGIPPYPYARALISDLTECGIIDIQALWEMARDGIASVEVDDYTGNHLCDVFALYANRGDLYTDAKKRKEGE